MTFFFHITIVSSCRDIKCCLLSTLYIFIPDVPKSYIQSANIAFYFRISKQIRSKCIIYIICSNIIYIM